MHRWFFLAALVCCLQDVNAQRVYRDKVEPHWFAANTQFWYRNTLPNHGREFIHVDAAKGTRSPAFDHAAVAKQLSELLKMEVLADQLPIDSIEFSEDGTSLRLIGKSGQFQYQTSSGTVSKTAEGAAERSTVLFLPPRPSGSAGDETEIHVRNELDVAVKLFWINATGESVPYGAVAPGESRQQHTFAGHVWLFRKADDSDIGCAEGIAGGSDVVLNAATLGSVKRRTRQNRKSDRSDRSENSHGSESSDRTHSVFVKNNNLWLKDLASGNEHPLSTDATAAHTFRKDASRARGIDMDYNRADYPEHVADAQWSGDGSYVLAMQTTQVPERLVHYIESAPSDQLQPKLQSYPYWKPGDEIPVATPHLFRIADRQEIAVSNELFANPWSLQFQRWSDDGTRFWLLYNERGHQRLRLLEVTVATGAVRAVIDEHSSTFIHYSSDGKMELRWLNQDKVLWASERSGWNHLYRYDLSSDTPLNAVTSGEWNVRRIVRLDEQAGIVWFFAVGVRSDQDPYHQHFCRVNLDGSDLRILTEGDGTHDIEWSPDHRWLIDRYSRVDLPPVTELRTADGVRVCQLEEADASEIISARGSLPERFVAKGRDGKTDIWGIVHRPKSFDENRPIPVIENIYAGPHDHHVPKAFRTQYRHQQAIADAGFLVVQIDGMGTAWRSKAFHDVCFRNLRDAGFPDRILWLKALKEKIPQMDLTRVGIYGGSAGGQNAMAALLWHNDFYKAAVADCGCHDNRMDKIWWNEQWMGVPDGDHYAQNSNMEHAELLQGKLMLVVGELDRNVDPATSTQVARKLVAAEKDFDFVVVPGAGHGACETPWASRRRTEFFIRTLQSGD
jgi:dipeptidyl aminopeptidase/acylaminoacyl peptidase